MGGVLSSEDLRRRIKRLGAYPAANVPGMYLKYREISEVVGLHPVFRIIKQVENA